MYVVAVDFKIHEANLSAFMPLISENARLSRTTEPGCQQFDVCVDPAQPTAVFLYELYDDRSAFEAHMATSHFKRFDAETAAMIASKKVHLLDRVAP